MLSCVMKCERSDVHYITSVGQSGIEHLTGLWKVIGVNPVEDSDFFFVPHLVKFSFSA